MVWGAIAVVLGRIAEALRKLVSPSGEEAVGIVGERPGLEPLEAQKAYITTYAGVRGLRLKAIYAVSTPEEAVDAIRRSRGSVILIYSPELLGPEGERRAEEEAGGSKIVFVRRELSGPKLGC